MVKAKKHLGQHFLLDEGIASDIVKLLDIGDAPQALEIGPGTGVLTKYLLERGDLDVHVVELDRESVAYLEQHYPALRNKIHAEDFLRMSFDSFEPKFSVIGNFPYNISSQILFKILDNFDQVPQVVGMFQKEVAERVASGPGNKSYGILSVLLQAYYDIEYAFTVGPEVFDPPPKVQSGVIKLTRNDRKELPCDPSLFKAVIKTAFNQRRKTLRNSLSGMMDGHELPEEFSGKRPEQLSVEEFFRLTLAVAKHH